MSGAQGLQQTISEADTSKLEKQTTAFSDHVSKAYKQTSSPLWQVASVVPYVGDDISAVRTTVAAMENISSQALPQLVKVAENVDLNSIHVENGTIEIFRIGSVSAAAPNRGRYDRQGHAGSENRENPTYRADRGRPENRGNVLRKT
mgnify:CR=1 FL=1